MKGLKGTERRCADKHQLPLYKGNHRVLSVETKDLPD